MAFPLSDEQRLLADVARSFAWDRLAPGAHDRDRTGEYPRTFVDELAALGLLAMKVSADWGGSALDNVGYVLAMEAVAEADASTAVILAASNMATWIIDQHGSTEQCDQWLRPYAAGELGPVSFALTEPHCGSDASALRTQAVRDGDGYRLTGQKMWITSGAFAGLHLVFACTGEGPRGISCFLVPAGAEGLAIGREEDKMGQRASGTVALHLDDVFVPADQRIGEEGQGYGIALSALAAGRVGMAGLCIGIGEAALAAGLRYAADRRAFGKRVLDFQNSRFQLADCRVELDAAWLLALRGARLLDQGHRAAAESSAAKLYASEATGRVVDRMVQLHGGYGYSREYDIERYYRDARITRIYEGSSEIQRLVLARALVDSLEVPA
ncbi:MAG: acyl-CoA dehydrogenase family protein [Alphaproteobacteria bacterium]|nr:acyl-CoA dehydrogenase family protein [Alphaproteobacteria bacterium]